MTTIKTHTGAHITRKDYLSPFAGTAAEQAHTIAADQGVTLSELRRVQAEKRDTIGNRKSFEAAVAMHEKTFPA